MPPITPPVAGNTHHLVLKYGPPPNPLYQGLMLPDGDLKKYIVQPYTPFAPQSRQGNATIQDFSVATVWELNADFAGGAGHTREKQVETGVYAYSQGNNATGGGLGTTLFTAQKGRLLPAPAHADANVGGAIASGNIKQFIEFKSRLYGLTDENPGKIYQWDSGGTTPTLKLTLNSHSANTTGIQLSTDGNKLYVTRGTSQPAMSTTDGTTWVDESFSVNPDFIGFGAATSYNSTGVFIIGKNGSNYASIDPGAASLVTLVGWQGNAATNAAFLRGAIVVGKPEGLYVWVDGRVECKFPCFQAVDPVNFSKMAVHNNLLWFNFKNRLFFTDLQTITEVYPEDRGGFQAITCLVGTGGPLLIGAKWYPIDGSLVNQGPSMAAAFSNDTSIGSIAWSNPSNASASDDLYATASGTGVANYLKATNFGFGIPTNAIITGITVRLELHGTGFHEVGDYSIRLVKGGVISGNDNILSAFWGPSDYDLVYGSFTDLWGLSLVPADVNSSNFGVAISANLSGGGGVTAYIDQIRMTVYYTVGGNAQNCLFMLNSVQDAGLNPLWTDASGSNPMYAAYATSAPDANAARVYTCSDHAHWKVRYIDLDTRFVPRRYDTNTMNISYIDLVEFSGGFASIKKWWYECVLNAVNPNQNTFVQVFYSIDGRNFVQTLDQADAPVEHILNARSLGSYLPLDTVGTYNQLRLYLRTTADTGPAAITTVTLRGDVVVKPRYQFQFPVDCSETVLPLQGVAENGHTIWQNLKAASQQGYPCKLQDPEGNWHLVLFQTSPYFSTADYRVPSGGGKLIPYGVVTAVLEEIDALASDGSLNPWSAG